jgi:peptidoglycan/xylan/chitin deacetylase (PgdA/CDA1 family)
MARFKSTRSVNSTRGIFVGALALAALVAFVSGCGQSKPAAVGPHYNLFADLASKLQADYGAPGKGVVIDGRLVTMLQGDLRGSLPPVKPEVVTSGNPKLKRVALTLDDGWNADMRILDLLKSRHVKFTTFLIGDRGVADANPGFVKAIKDAGGEVCSHTWDHYVMRGKDEGTVMNEIWASQDVITKVTHEIYPYIRFSGGAYDQAALDWTAREGYWVVNWSVSDNDTANGVTPDSQVNAVLGGLKPGAIILCHWGGHNTFEVLSRALPEIQARGYEVTSLTGVFEGTPYILKGTGAGARKYAPGYRGRPLSNLEGGLSGRPPYDLECGLSGRPEPGLRDPEILNDPGLRDPAKGEGN